MHAHDSEDTSAGARAAQRRRRQKSVAEDGGEQLAVALTSTALMLHTPMPAVTPQCGVASPGSTAAAFAEAKKLLTEKFCDICGDSSLEVAWHTTSVVQSNHDKWELAPKDGLCKKCGKVIFSFTGEDDKSKLVARARKDRAWKAEVILMGEIWSGKQSPSWQSESVRVMHATGFESKAEVAMVTTEDFAAHMGTDLAHISEELRKKKGPAGRVVDFLNHKGWPSKGVIMGNDSSLKDSGIKHEIHTQFNRTESQWLEYQMLPADKVRLKQGKELHDWSSKGLIATQPSPLVGKGLLEALTYDDWDTMCESVDVGRSHNSAAPKMDVAAASSWEMSAGPQVASVAKPGAKPGAKRPGAKAAGAAGRGRGRGRTRDKSANPSMSHSVSRSRSRSPRARHRSGGSIGLSGGESEAEGDELLTRSGRKSKPVKGGRSYTSKSWEVKDILNCPDGGKLGRSIPVISLAAFA